MRTRYGWFLAAVAGAALAGTGVARAQGEVPGAPGTPMPSMPATGTEPRPGGAPLGAFQPPPLIRPGQPLSVLVFPFSFGPPEGEAAPAPAPAAPGAAQPVPPGAEPAQPAEVTPPQPVPPDAGTAMGSHLTAEQIETAGYLTAAVKAGFLSTPAYLVATYHPQSSLIQRARKDDILKPEHVTGLVSPDGVVNLEKARAVAYRLGMQALLVGNLDLKRDPQTNAVEITVQTQLINSTTGEVLRSAAVSGAAVGAEGVPVVAIQERAALDAAQKVLPAMGIQLVPKTSGSSAKSEKGRNSSRGSQYRNEKRPEPRRSSASFTDEEKQQAKEEARLAEERARQARLETERAHKAQREAERDADRARRDAERTNRNRKDGDALPPRPALPADPSLAPAVPLAPAAPVPPAAPPAQPGAEPAAPAAPAPPAVGAPAAVPAPDAVALPAGSPGTVRGVAGVDGRPIPYGYAQADKGLPKKGFRLRLPPWFGVSTILGGLTFFL